MGGTEASPRSAGEFVGMIAELPANNGDKEGVALPGVPGQLVVEEKRSGFLCLY